MKQIIIFRYHSNIEICKNHLELIRKLNPKIPIHGIYGGNKFSATRKLKEYFTTNYNIIGKTGHWKWKNFDIALREWYKQIGRKLDFEMAYIIEWDLVMHKPIATLYKHIGKNQIGVTGLIKLSKVEHHWDWTKSGKSRKEWIRLFSYAKKQFRYNKQPYACVGPGMCLPKGFLDRYSKINVPELCHDELRIPLFAQILGFQLKDTGFFKGWLSEKGEDCFNCNKKEVTPTIAQELKKKNGIRAFHPVRRKIY